MRWARVASYVAPWPCRRLQLLCYNKIMRSSWGGRVCLVTGGTQGLGWAMVQVLAECGATVYACGLSESRVAAARQAMAPCPWRDWVHLRQCDVAKPDQVSALLGDIRQRHGAVYLLVNNAAYVRWADITEMSLHDEVASMRVGYEGMIHTVREVLPHMLAEGQGYIVNIGSIAGRIFVGGASAAYSATKAAIDAYTRALQHELAGSGVTATIVRLATVSGTSFFREHVSRERMPPFTRFIPALTPPEAARRVLRSVERGSRVVTVPRYLSLLAWFYELAPVLAGKVAWYGGSNPRDYANVDWQIGCPE
jgi:NAD(P)-dependent dehydrogenase (short-subunit alcohol dehydrogenase family)